MMISECWLFFDVELCHYQAIVFVLLFIMFVECGLNSIIEFLFIQHHVWSFLEIGKREFLKNYDSEWQKWMKNRMKSQQIF